MTNKVKKYFPLILFILFGFYLIYRSNKGFTVTNIVFNLISSILVYLIFIWGYNKPSKKKT